MSFKKADLGVAPGVRLGRVPVDGYARGWGLEFGGLQEAIAADPLYVESLRLTIGRSVQSELRRMNIFMLLTNYLPNIPKGNVVELGVYKGGSALFMANVLKAGASEVSVTGFDTFEGMPYADNAIDAHKAGDFAGVDFEELRQHASDAKLDNLQFVKGKFEETLPEALDRIAPLALVHIDCDVYDAVKFSYEAVKDRMVPGGYIVLDDATTSSCIGATEVVEDVLIRRDGLNSEQIFPHYVFRIGLT